MCLYMFTLQSYGFLAELSSKMQYIQNSRLAVRQKLISFATNIATLFRKSKRLAWRIKV